MYAIIEDSGTQIRVSSGDVIDIDLRDAEAGSSLTFDRVLLIGDDPADDSDAAAAARVGTPYLDGATVTAEVQSEFRARKIDVIKYKRRKGYRRKVGHRQRYLRVTIGSISG